MLALTFEDNGKGFASGAAHTGSGLLNITERVRMLHGKLQIDSSVGRSTTISIRLTIRGNGRSDDRFIVNIQYAP